jgi:hypothetical protein
VTVLTSQTSWKDHIFMKLRVDAAGNVYSLRVSGISVPPVHPVWFNAVSIE